MISLTLSSHVWTCVGSGICNNGKMCIICRVDCDMPHANRQPKVERPAISPRFIDRYIIWNVTCHHHRFSKINNVLYLPLRKPVTWVSSAFRPRTLNYAAKFACTTSSSSSTHPVPTSVSRQCRQVANPCGRNKEMVGEPRIACNKADRLVGNGVKLWASRFRSDEMENHIFLEK